MKFRGVADLESQQPPGKAVLPPRSAAGPVASGAGSGPERVARGQAASPGLRASRCGIGVAVLPTALILREPARQRDRLCPRSRQRGAEAPCDLGCRQARRPSASFHCPKPAARPKRTSRGRAVWPPPLFGGRNCTSTWLRAGVEGRNGAMCAPHHGRPLTPEAVGWHLLPLPSPPCSQCRKAPLRAPPATPVRGPQSCALTQHRIQQRAPHVCRENLPPSKMHGFSFSEAFQSNDLFFSRNASVHPWRSQPQVLLTFLINSEASQLSSSQRW